MIFHVILEGVRMQDSTHSMGLETMHFDNFVTHKNKSSGLNEQSQTHTCIMIFRVKAFLTLIALTSAAAANAVNYCDGVASVTVVSSTAANDDDLEQSFELYRTLLGGNNKGK